jgi:hypothetical protein
VGRRVDPDRKGNDPNEDRRGECQQYRQEHTIADHGGDRQLILETITEIALQHVAEPNEILLDHRAVETVEPSQALDIAHIGAFAARKLLVDHRGQKIARRQLDDKEADRANGEQRRYHHEQPPGDVSEHKAGNLYLVLRHARIID